MAPAAAQVRDGPPGVAERDEYNPRPPFSGALFRGLTNATPPDTAHPASVILHVPLRQEGGSRVCIRLYSADATYQGWFRFERPAQPGWYRFALPTRHLDRLREMGPRRLAPLAYFSAACGEGRNEKVYVPALFGTSTSPTRLRLVVLSTGVRGVRAVVQDSLPFRCSLVEGAGYNHECGIDLAPAPHAQELVVQERLPDGTIRSAPMKVWREQ